MTRIIAPIAQATLLEATRSRMLWLVGVLLLLSLAAAGFLGQVAIVEAAEIRVTVVAALLRAAAAFLTAAFVVMSMVRESNDKVLELMLAQPWPRAAYLFGKSLAERAIALVEIAHPDDRAGLLDGAIMAAALALLGWVVLVRPVLDVAQDPLALAISAAYPLGDLRLAVKQKRLKVPSEAIALDTTGSSVIPVDAQLDPLDDYYLWCDHRAKGEARDITDRGRAGRRGSRRAASSRRG